MFTPSLLLLLAFSLFALGSPLPASLPVCVFFAVLGDSGLQIAAGPIKTREAPEQFCSSAGYFPTAL